MTMEENVAAFRRLIGEGLEKWHSRRAGRRVNLSVAFSRFVLFMVYRRLLIATSLSPSRWARAIKGWDLGVKGMLVFDVELVGVQ